MKEHDYIRVDKHTKILVPASAYNIESDTRLLIPFTCGETIGFVNSEGNIVVQPKYSMYYGEIYSEDDYMKVSIVETYGFPRSAGKVSTYKRSLFGLINKDGVEVLKPVYLSMLLSIGCDEVLLTVQRDDYEWGVIDIKGNEIVPFGKYAWLDGFDHGFARVKLRYSLTNDKWGIINCQGEEVLPVEYSNIWNFYDKNRHTVRVEKGGISKDFTLRHKTAYTPRYSNNDYCSHYGEYAGSYAQDVMGYSDDVINDAFDGEPDAYWNID